MIEVFPLFREWEDLVAHFAGRAGGVSEAPFDTLNLGFSTGDAPACVVENRRRLAVHLRAPLECWVVCGQVHGSRVFHAGEEWAGEGATRASQELPAADAIYLPGPGLFALALSADCPLVAVCHAEARRVGIAHAGWRGTAAGVVEALVASFRADGSPPEALVASLSTGICGACYSVGEEVMDACSGKPGFGEARRGGCLDLRVMHAEILRRQGIPTGAIEVSPHCSACRPTSFFSHRRDAGRTGRNGALVGWRDGKNGP